MLHNNIKQIRKQKKISVTELASKLSMSQSNLTKIENGQIELKAEVAEQIAQALGVSVTSIMALSHAAEEIPVINPKELIKNNISSIECPPFLALPQKEIALFIAEDNAMQPNINLGEAVILDTSITKYTKDGVYLLQYNDTFSLRRLQNTFDGHITIVSDNHGYQTIVFNEKEVMIIGKAISVIRQISL